MTKITRLFNIYGIFGCVRLSIDWITTKVVMPKARILRRPFYIRGSRWMRIGSNLTTGPGVRLDALSQQGDSHVVLTIGSDVQLNDYVHIAAAQSVIIGNRVLIASKVFISDHNHGNYKGEEAHDSPLTPPIKRSIASSPVAIEDDVWIGEFVCILPGVKIGRGSIIGAMSTVTHDVPAYSMAVGSPARVIRQFNLATSRWEKV